MSFFGTIVSRLLVIVYLIILFILLRFCHFVNIKTVNKDKRPEHVTYIPSFAQSRMIVLDTSNQSCSSYFRSIRGDLRTNIRRKKRFLAITCCIPFKEDARFIGSCPDKLFSKVQYTAFF
jgi:hypothetical protein